MQPVLERLAPDLEGVGEARQERRRVAGPLAARGLPDEAQEPPRENSDSCGAVAADRRTRCGPGAHGGACGGLYSSRIRCALEPPAPKELTAARRGSSRAPPSTAATRALQGVGSCWTKKGERSKSILGFVRDACSEGAGSPCLSWRRTLVRPAMPAAASRCPMFVFALPMAQKPTASVKRR